MSETCYCDRYGNPHTPQPACKRETPEMAERESPAPEDQTEGHTEAWRKLIPVHPLADEFPMMGAKELRTLADDIKTNGLRQCVTTFAGQLLDGRNRLAAMELADLPIRVKGGALYSKQNSISSDLNIQSGNHDPEAFVISANIHRRHLTNAGKRELIEKLLKTAPEKSDRVIAAIAKVDGKTVGKVRAATAEVPQSDTRTGADGKARKLPVKTPEPTVAEPVAEPPPPVDEDRMIAEMGGPVPEPVDIDVAPSVQAIRIMHTLFDQADKLQELAATANQRAWVEKLQDVLTSENCWKEEVVT